MRLQRYVKPFAYDKRAFLFDQIGAKIYEIPYSTFNTIQQGRYDDLAKEQQNLYTFLRLNFIIVDDNFDDAHYLDYKIEEYNKANDNIFSLTIAPTLNCNFKCIYCYEEGKGRQPIFMSKRTADATINFIKNHITTNNTKLFITWYGGEPLLAIHTVYYISQELKKTYGNRLNASIITNGFLLTEKVAKMLQESNVTSVQITVDGLKETQNRRRPFIIEGVDTYTTVMNNIKNNAHYFKVISLRVNVDKDNENEVPFLAEEVWKNCGNNVSVYIARTRLESYFSTRYNKDICFTDEEWAEYVSDNPSSHSALRAIYGCGATRSNSFVIDAFGDLSKCWHEVGQHDKAVGDVVNGITNWDRYMRWMSYGVNRFRDECKECFLLGLCAGGQCPYKTLFPSENLGPGFCLPEKYNLEMFLRRAIDKNHNIIQVGFSNKMNIGGKNINEIAEIRQAV